MLFEKEKSVSSILSQEHLSAISTASVNHKAALIRDLVYNAMAI
ncbi:hypothetical protein HMPREF0539_0404 [Lacticaseibacillus rhamnosus LMS2-1]|uniref:Uncharacterized protein n=1 Tax=Lacticaseibacillus rhamnosus (strain LMS2-1) TaxID=525361 RepID=C2JU20_LACRM|nr:hypothetical protein HMPREF0539_0404 [Lacticaseibacillus rhamnosus LMS2-1]